MRGDAGRNGRATASRNSDSLTAVADLLLGCCCCCSSNIQSTQSESSLSNARLCCSRPVMPGSRSVSRLERMIALLPPSSLTAHVTTTDEGAGKRERERKSELLVSVPAICLASRPSPPVVQRSLDSRVDASPAVVAGIRALAVRLLCLPPPPHSVMYARLPPFPPLVSLSPHILSLPFALWGKKGRGMA